MADKTPKRPPKKEEEKKKPFKDVSVKKPRKKPKK